MYGADFAAATAFKEGSSSALTAISTIDVAGWRWEITRPKPFVVVIHGGVARGENDKLHSSQGFDYLHEVLLAPDQRDAFFAWVDATGLIVCKNLATSHASYRDVRGRSSRGRLSQGEYYHHDGCSGPKKPRVVEIRCPYQDYTRSVATAVAPFHAVVPAMLESLPARLVALLGQHEAIARIRAKECVDDAVLDHVQGSINRVVRRELAAEEARAYFRVVDRAADAYFAPWERGESRLIANDNGAATMQHRRAYQEVHRGGVPMGRLVKRWPAEELVESGQSVDPAIAALRDCEADGACFRSQAGDAL